MKTAESQLHIEIANLRAENQQLRLEMMRLEWLLANANETINRIQAEGGEDGGRLDQGQD